MKTQKTKIESIKVQWIDDDDPDLSWLDQTNDEMGAGFEEMAERRKESYGLTWHMIGCVAKAEVSYPIGNGSKRLETLTSGGLWGIESDSDDAYLKEIASDQMQELSDHLAMFGIETTKEELEQIAE